MEGGTWQRRRGFHWRIWSLLGGVKARMKLSDLKAWERNPRTIDEPSADGLRESIQRFGDISGIVVNRRNGALVAGHQRAEQARELCGGGDPDIVMMDDDIGHFDVGGERFSVRFVDWDSSMHAAANVAANNPFIAGDFTDEIEDFMRDVEKESAELFESLRLDELLLDEDEQIKGETVLKSLDTRKPPAMTWCLIGLPTIRWGEVALLIEELSTVQDVVMEMTANDG